MDKKLDYCFKHTSNPRLQRRWTEFKNFAIGRIFSPFIKVLRNNSRLQNLLLDSENIYYKGLSNTYEKMNLTQKRSTYGVTFFRIRYYLTAANQSFEEEILKTYLFYVLIFTDNFSLKGSFKLYKQIL